MRIQIVRLSLLPALLGGQVTAFAQAETGEALVLQPVEVKASKEDDNRSSLTRKTIVRRDEIARYGDTSVVGVLRRVPGVTVNSSQGRPGDVRIGGLGNGYTQILINGEPAPAGFTLDSLSPSVIDRIEVLRAPTADASMQAIAGTINIILMQAEGNSQREIRVGVGSSDGSPLYSLDGRLTETDGRLSYSLAGSFARQKDLWPSQIVQSGNDVSGEMNLLRYTTRLENGAQNTFSVTPNVTWKFGSTDKLSMEGYVRYYSFNGGVDESRNIVIGESAPYSADALFLHIHGTTTRFRLGWTKTFANHATLETKIGVNSFRRAASSTFLGYGESSELALIEQVSSRASDLGYVTTGKLRLPYTEEHAISLGWDIDAVAREESRIQTQVSPIKRATSDLDERYQARVGRAAIYAQDEWELTKSLSAYLGLRWEGLWTETSGAEIVSTSGQFGVLSPVLQSVWQISEGGSDQIRSSVSRTYRAPRTRDLVPRRYVATDNTPTTPDTQGNPALRPELAWSFDLGYEHYLPEKAGMLSLTMNIRRISNVIVDQLVYSNGWLSTKSNLGGATVYGLEAETKMSLRKLSTKYPDMDFRASVSRNFSSVDNIPGPNNRLDSQIPLSASVGIDWRLSDFLPLTSGITFAFQGGGSVRTSENQTIRTSPRRSLDIYGLWRIEKSTKLRLAISNIIRQDNVAEAAYSDSNGSFQQSSIAPSRIKVRLILEAGF